MAKLIDPRANLDADRKAHQMPSSSEAALSGLKAGASKSAEKLPPAAPGAKTLEQAAHDDFRVFLTLIWRFLLGVDPSAIQLDMAYWLQHGPDRAIIMAFRGFSKSWITGAYGLWRLYRDPNEQILIVSGSMGRSIATVNWALHIIMNMEFLAHMRPKPTYRASGMKFDVGSCLNPGQSASFSAFGIGGQLVGFRGTCIIPDDVETQTNSLTVVMRDKIVEGVKEFESVLTPNGVIKYLGTPHDVDSLYLKLLRLKDKHNKQIYQARIWPGLFPTEEEIKGYGDLLAPYITAQIRKHGPSIVGHSTMPNRFTDADLEKRRAAMGNSEFRLQFMLDLKGSFIDKYPLKLKDLIVTSLDDHRGPLHITWGQTHIHRDLPVMGFDGDFYYEPHDTATDTAEWQKVIGYVDSSGRGVDETALSIVALLHGRAYWLHLYANLKGYEEATLVDIAKACIRFGVHELHIESNFGGGMFAALMRPVLLREWEKHTAGLKAKGTLRRDARTGTAIIEVTATSKAAKEQRILAILEPVTQGHRLVVSSRVVQSDYAMMMSMEAEDTKRYYAWGYQFTHLTKERDCLGHDDRLDALAGAIGVFAEELGVDPELASRLAKEEKGTDWLRKLMDEQDAALGLPSRRDPQEGRMQAARPRQR